MKVLIADDEPAVLSLIGTIVEERGDCELHVAADGCEAFDKLARHRPDLLITDLKMPSMGGEELTARARELQPDLTILVETGNPTVEGAVRLMKDGVFDFVTKPFELEDLERRIDLALDHSRKGRGEHSVDATVNSLMAALGRKDPYLREHSYRVSDLARHLGRRLGLSAEEVKHLSWAALVHDVGKIGVPGTILHKKGRLSDAEFELIKRHPIYSWEIIRPIAYQYGGKSTEAVVYHHHERIDGQGYPDGLRGNEIPLGARIICVCDSYDAMASDRPYRSRLPEAEIREILRKCSGTQFEGGIVQEFLQQLDEYEAYVATGE